MSSQSQSSPKLITLYDWTEYGLKNVTETSDYSKPTVICLGGGDTTEAKALRYARFIQTFLGRRDIFTPELRIVSATYPYDEMQLMEFARNHNYGRAQKGYFDDMALQFVKRQFLPLLADNAQVDKDGNITGEKLPLEKIKRNFSNVRIMTHSVGAIVSEQIGNALVHSMKKLGYSDQEIGEATRQILVMNIGSVAYATATNKPLASFTQITLLHSQDAQVNAFNNSVSDILTEIEDYGRTEKVGGRTVIKPLHILPASSSSLHKVTVFADTIGDPNVLGPEGYVSVNHTGHLITEVKERAGDREIKHFAVNTPIRYDVKHPLDYYLEPKLGKNGLIVSTMMQSALINALNNSIANMDTSHEFTPLPLPRELFVPPEEVNYTRAELQERGIYGNPKAVAIANNYAERIEQALAEDPARAGQRSIWQR